MRLASDARMRREMFFNNPAIKKLVDKGKRVGFITGQDKPRLKLINNHWNLSFLDTWRNLHWTSQHQFTQGPFIEFFYFSRDLPELIVKSCYMLINYFETNWTKSQCNNYWIEGNIYKDINRYHSITNSILYKDTWSEGSTFSLGKNQANGLGTNQFFCQKALFLTKRHKDWQNYKIWVNGLNEMFSHLDEKFYQKFKQINGHWSKNYPIKTLNCLKNF